jgi:hypothetical protein
MSVHADRPWFNALHDHVAARGGRVDLAVFELEGDGRGDLKQAGIFVVSVFLPHQGDQVCRGSERSYRIEEAAERLCRQLDVDILEAA